MSTKSVLLLLEGPTEKEFYHKLLNDLVPNRTFKVKPRLLKGNSGVTLKVKAKLKEYEQNAAKDKTLEVHVFVAHDRDGARQRVESKLDIKKLKADFCTKGSIYKDIKEVVATIELESWFFYDINGIYNFLGVPMKRRQTSKFRSPESLKSSNLSALFRQTSRKFYHKGKLSQGLVESLDMKLIHDSCDDIQVFIADVKKLL